MAANPEDLRRFFETQKLRFNRCLEPTATCKEAPIRAHSIQNARVIDLIATNGHVIQPKMKFLKDGADIEFKLVGRNEASTFTGLWATPHD